MTSVCIYCGSSSGSDPRFVDVARDLGEVLVARGIRLVYGGGGVGLMGAVADSVLEGGGNVVGVIPEFLRSKELAHPEVDDMVVVESMHDRKREMIELADGFIALPGGFGTLEELFEVIAWNQLQLHKKPVGILNTAGFYDGLITCLDRMVADKFLRPADRGRLLVDTDIEGLLASMDAWRPPADAKWDDPEFIKIPDRGSRARGR